MYSLKILYIFFTFLWLVEGQLKPCTTPNTECKSIKECLPLATLLNKRGRTQEETNLLVKSHCGYIGSTHAVCCPKIVSAPAPTQTPRPTLTPAPQPQPECYTPNGKEGQCIPLNSCEPLTNLLVKSKAKHIVRYAQRSICNAAEKKVCCGPLPNFSEQTGMCPGSVSALPPEPSSNCCGRDSRLTNKIVGGEAADIDEFPWLALIEYKQGTKVKTLCGGALISAKYVLSAAHCFVGEITRSGRPTHIRLGEYDTSHVGPDCVKIEDFTQDCNDGIFRSEIEKKIVHTGYNMMYGNRHNDIALAKMREMAPFTAFIRPICLPSEDMTLRTAPFNMTVAGWGSVGENKNRSNIKLYIEVPFVSQADCQPHYTAFRRRETLWKGQMCAGGEVGKDSCRGDSGGPLMYASNNIHTVVGIVSFGDISCGEQNVPGVYTNVYEYLSWINENIEQ